LHCGEHFQPAVIFFQALYDNKVQNREDAAAGTVSVFVNGVQLLIKTRGQYTPALHIPVGIPYAAIPVSFFFMALFAFAQILEITMGKELPERIKYS